MSCGCIPRWLTSISQPVSAEAATADACPCCGAGVGCRCIGGLAGWLPGKGDEKVAYVYVCPARLEVQMSLLGLDGQLAAADRGAGRAGAPAEEGDEPVAAEHRDREVDVHAGQPGRELVDVDERRVGVEESVEHGTLGGIRIHRTHVRTGGLV